MMAQSAFRLKHAWSVAALALLAAMPANARNADASIRQVLTRQQAAWNLGDIDNFMHGYEDSPETTFIGKTVEHGYQQILARYKRVYSSKAAMGQLEFSDIEVRMLGEDHAVVTGHFHLGRSAAAGGDAAGVFSLIFQHDPDGWRIILDHTS